jgi:hypothetical protein
MSVNCLGVGRDEIGVGRAAFGELSGLIHADRNETGLFEDGAGLATGTAPRSPYGDVPT